MATPEEQTSETQPTLRPRPIVVGLIGGIASGKSLVAHMLCELGAERIDADSIARPMTEEPAIYQQLVATFGPSILDADKKIIRQEIGRRVFGDDPAAREQRQQLNAIMLPVIGSRIAQKLAELLGQSQLCMIILDAPLLLESGWNLSCDHILFVETPANMRQQFALSRGWSEDEWQRRERSQWSIKQKRRAASDILTNDGDQETLKRRVHDWYHSVCGEDRASTGNAK